MRKSSHVTSASTKDLLETRVEKRIGFRTCSTIRSWQLSGSFQSNQPILNPIRERPERPVIRDDARTVENGRKTSRSHEINVSSFHEESVFFQKERGGPLLKVSIPCIDDHHLKEE